MAHRSHSSWNFLSVERRKDVFCRVNEETQGIIHQIRGLASRAGGLQVGGAASVERPALTRGEECGVELLGRRHCWCGRVVSSGAWEVGQVGGWAGQMMEEANPIKW